MGSNSAQLSELSTPRPHVHFTRRSCKISKTSEVSCESPQTPQASPNEPFHPERGPTRVASRMLETIDRFGLSPKPRFPFPLNWMVEKIRTVLDGGSEKVAGRGSKGTKGAEGRRSATEKVGGCAREVTGAISAVSCVGTRISPATLHRKAIPWSERQCTTWRNRSLHRGGGGRNFCFRGGSAAEVAYNARGRASFSFLSFSLFLPFLLSLCVRHFHAVFPRDRTS